jgi:hypothetical protein
VRWRGSSPRDLTVAMAGSVLSSGRRKQWHKGKTAPAVGPFIDDAMRRSRGVHAEVRPVGGITPAASSTRCRCKGHSHSHGQAGPRLV